MTFREARKEGSDRLARANVDSSSLDSSLLLSYATGFDRVRLLALSEEEISADRVERFRSLIERRASGICVAYLLGLKEFRGLDFVVTPAVLVPRPDTETLVEAALEWIDERVSLDPEAPAKLCILDVCTGSGCIAVALKAERPEVFVSACDISSEALAVARTNSARLLGAIDSTDQVSFFLGDLLTPVPGIFDLIVSNPPYIPSAQIDTLAREVRNEPNLALDGGNDGFDTIRRLVPDAFEKLNNRGRLLIEAGHDQGAGVAKLMAEAGFTDIFFYPDLAG
ncbi:MAG: peptide chain release factor N(5)-glutamine methyltransferase, partial [Treponemataceae bacterium]